MRPHQQYFGRIFGRAAQGWPGQDGAALLAVLLTITLILIVTVAVMAIVQADLAAGIRQQQAVQVFNIAEAGVHHAIARLQTTGAQTYAGETISMTDGSATLGEAAVVIECLDGTSPATIACAGATAAYRRVRSTGTLTVAGPVRVVTAVLEGTTSVTSNYAVCGYDGVDLDQSVRVYGDVGSNANVTLARGSGPARICDSSVGGSCPAPYPPSSQAYSGSAYAVGTITCGGGTCNSSQIEGTIAPNQPVGSVCPAVTLEPPSPPGETPLNVPGGSTVTVDPSVNYGAVTLASTGTDACPADVNHRATLVIDSGANPEATITVRMRSLRVGKCARVVILGTGKVVLWILEPATVPPEAARQALKAEQLSVFGSTTTGATPTPISGGRFTVNILSSKPMGDSGDCLDGAATCPAAHFSQSG